MFGTLLSDKQVLDFLVARSARTKVGHYNIVGCETELPYWLDNEIFVSEICTRSQM